MKLKNTKSKICPPWGACQHFVLACKRLRPYQAAPDMGPRSLCTSVSVAGATEYLTLGTLRAGVRESRLRQIVRRSARSVALSTAQSEGSRKCRALGDGCECQIKVKSMICQCQDSRNDEYGGWTLTIEICQKDVDGNLCESCSDPGSVFESNASDDVSEEIVAIELTPRAFGSLSSPLSPSKSPGPL